MKLFEMLKAVAPSTAPICDDEEIKKNYRYWRLRIFLGMYIGYIFYYFSRKSFAFAMPVMIQEMGFSKAELGILGSILALSYGASKFLSGILSDRSNPRYFMGIGLILTGVFNIFFGFSSTILFFGIFWGLNGWFQGWGWPPCARLLTYWYSHKERGTWWGVCSTAHSVGGGLIPIVAAACAQQLGWRYAMYIPGLLCIAIGLFVMMCLRDTPESLGLPSIEKFKNDYPEGKVHEEKDLSMKRILFEYVLKNSYIWLLAVSYFFVYIVRTAVNDWGTLYLVENKGYSLMLSSLCITWFEAGGVCGCLVAGWASDKIFRGCRAPVNVIFSVLVLLGLAGLWLSPGGQIWLDGAFMFLIGFFIFGPQMLIGMAAVEISHKKAAGTANGFTGWWAYLGAAVAGYPLGQLTQDYGWEAFFVVLSVCSLVAAALLLPMWRLRANPKYLLVRDRESVAAKGEPAIEATSLQPEVATSLEMAVDKVVASEESAPMQGTSPSSAQTE